MDNKIGISTTTLTNENNSIIFQIIDWIQYNKKFDTENIESSNDSDSNDELEKELYGTESDKIDTYKIRLYGRTEDNKSIVVNVNNYTPFFYIKVNNDWTDSKIRILITHIKSKISNPKIINGFKSFDILMRKDLYGFTGYKDFKFVKLVFLNMYSYKAFENYIAKNKIFNNSLSKNEIKLQLYESNIEPFIRCMHIRKLNACGWVKISKYESYDSTYSHCSLSIQTDWTNLEPYNSTSIQKFVIASWDIECMSWSGDFPQAIHPEDKNNFNIMMTELIKKVRKNNDKFKYINEETIKNEILLNPKSYPEYNNYEFKHTGDPIIQIGNTTSYYGESEPYAKTIITLGGCEKVKGLEDVEIKSFKYEKNVILAWAKLIRKTDPDIITGWNINGFDFQYLYDRAIYLKILGEFSEISRVRGEKAKFKEKMLSSSALGDNILKYFDMEGRIIIDMMKERQRESKLDSYKLDFVASTYIKEKMLICEIINDNKFIIYTSGIYGIKLLDYINITWDDGLNENKHDSKYKIIELEKVESDEITQLIKSIESYEKYSDYIFKKPKTLYKLVLDGKIPEEIFEIEEGNESMWKNVLRKDTETKSKIYFQIDGYTENKEFIKNNTSSQSWIDINYDESIIPIRGNKIFWAQAKDDISPKELFRLYKGSDTDRGIIAKYCVMDCVLVTKLMEKLKVLNNNIGMANVCGVPLNYIFMRGQGVKIFSLVSKKCRELGFLIPKKTPDDNKKNKNHNMTNSNYANSKKIDSDSESDSEEEKVGYEGATVFEPIKGIHYEPIPVLDYASLYPSSMIYMNISHECYINNHAYDNLQEYEYKETVYNNSDETTTTCRFAKKKDGTKGVLCQILEELLKKRKETKKIMGQAEIEGNYFLVAIYDGLQLAYKITANSLYGQVGAPTSPIYMKELAASTTSTGRKMLELARDFIEGTFGEIINLCINDKEKYYEFMKDLFKDVPLYKFIEPKVNRQNMLNYIDYFYARTNELLNSNYKVKPQVIYGDSVTADTPILLLNSSGNIEIKTIEEIGIIWKDYQQFKCDDESLTDKQQDDMINYKVWTDKGWSNIKRVIRHKTNKKIYEILTHTGIVKVTSDHSLLDINGNQIKPSECKVRTELLHKTLEIINREETIMNLNKAYIYGFFFGNGSCDDLLDSDKSKVKYNWNLNNYIPDLNNKLMEKLYDIYPNENFIISKIYGINEIVPSSTNIKKFVEEYKNKFYDKNKLKIIPIEILNGSYAEKESFLNGYYDADYSNKLKMKKNYFSIDIKGQVSALNVYYLVLSLGYNVSINKDKSEIFIIKYTKKNDRKNPNAILKINNLGYVEDYVYDLETDVGHFHAGVGSLIVKNTDSVFFSPKIYNITAKQIMTNKACLRVSIELGILAGEVIGKILPEPEDLEYEKTFWPFIILTKKRYTGNLYETDFESYKQKSMGIVLKRRDNAKIVKIVVGGIVDYILNGKFGDTNIANRNKGAIIYTKTLLKHILQGNYQIDKYIITKTLRANYKGIKKTDDDKGETGQKGSWNWEDVNCSLAHVSLCQRMAKRNPGNKPESNDRIPYVYIIPKGNVKLQAERIEDPKFVIEQKIELDYQFYITNQIMKPSIQFLEHIVAHPEKIFENYINKEINRRKKTDPVNNYISNYYIANNNSNSNNNSNLNNNLEDIESNNLKDTKNNEDRLINKLKINNKQSLTINI